MDGKREESFKPLSEYVVIRSAEHRARIRVNASRSMGACLLMQAGGYKR